MESPLFIDIVLYAIYVLLTAAILLTVWSVVRGFMLYGGMKARGYENGVPVRRIAWLTAGLLVVTLAVTWLTASTEPLNINGKTYTDIFWLRISDMFIITALVLIIITAGTAVFSILKSKL